MPIPQDVQDRFEQKQRHLLDILHKIVINENLTQDHRKVLTFLSQATMKTSFHVVLASSSKGLASEVNINYLAWAVRSLYEARVWVRYCKTAEKALRFAAAHTIDNADTIDAFMKFADRLAPADVANLKALRREIGQFRSTVPYSDKELRFKIIDVAIEVGLEQEHESMYKFLSKLLHVTALSAIGATDREKVETSMLPLVTYAEACLQEINQILSELGSKEQPVVQ